MEFNEKLQQLRKSRGLTQEELAEALFVSRTAVSKWESGRGYPNIDSLKEISGFFSVTVDELISGEKILSLAERENRSNILNLCNLLFGISDLFSVMLIVLPLYPNRVGDFIYSVNLIGYVQCSQIKVTVLWIISVSLFVLGIIKVILTEIKAVKNNKILTVISLVINVFAVIFLALAREAYAVVVAFFLLIAKVAVLLKRAGV